MKKSPSSFTAAALAVLGLICLPLTQTFAATYTWDGGGDGVNWSSGANWNPDSPTWLVTDSALFGDQAGDLVTTLDNSFTVGRVSFMRIDQTTAGGSTTINLAKNNFELPQNDGFRYNGATTVT